MFAYCALGIMTIIILECLAKQDLKERMVYTFPIILLHLMWSVYLVFSGFYSGEFLAVYWICHLIIYIFLNHFHIWGGGDSDLLILFSDMCLLGIQTENIYQFVFQECLWLIGGLVLSILIGRLEGRRKGYKCTLKTAVAVVPGVAIAMIFLLTFGGIWRFA